jgi:hypothetical protein
MPSLASYLIPGPDVSTWPIAFRAADLDYVPDPMVLRAAELFIGGRQYCRQVQKLDDEKVWPIIEKNIDGILAFFHVLMTRERVPLIDYESTFPSDFLRSLVGEITLEVHPDRAVYERLKTEGLQKLQSFDASRSSKKLVNNLRNELLAVGYSWVPELDGLTVDPTEKEQSLPLQTASGDAPRSF